MTASEIENGLINFCGSETFTRHMPGIILTEGALWLAENAGAFWLMDAIWSHQHLCRKDAMLRDMQFWKLKVNEDKSAVLTCERDEGNVAIRQEIEYTDFPLKEIKLYCAPSGNGKDYTVLLPSEW